MLLALAVFEEGNEFYFRLLSWRFTLVFLSSLSFRRILLIVGQGIGNGGRVLADPFPRSCAALAILAMSGSCLKRRRILVRKYDPRSFVASDTILSGGDPMFAVA